MNINIDGKDERWLRLACLDLAGQQRAREGLSTNLEVLAERAWDFINGRQSKDAAPSQGVMFGSDVAGRAPAAVNKAGDPDEDGEIVTGTGRIRTMPVGSKVTQ
jgi:hypothetical protein